jgi:glutaminase
LEAISNLAGGKKVGFDQPTYLAEYRTAYRNNALMHYMMSKNSFPPKTDGDQALDFYLQSCSVEIDCDTLAVIAATFSNMGTCPITSK